VRFLLDNLGLKTASLGLAILLWFVIAGETTSEMGLSVPLELQNFPRDMELTGDAAAAVDVRLRASPGILHALHAGDVSAQIDLAGTAEGERIVHITADSIRVPFGVKVVKITPSILTLNLERTLQKLVPIRPRLLGRPEPGFEVAEISADPGDVRIAGPKSRVQEVESAFTEPVSLDGARTTVSDIVNIGLEDPSLRIQGSPRVRVTAKVREVHETRSFEDVPLVARGGTGSFKPGAARVLLTGPASQLKRMAAADVKAFVDVSVRASGGRLPVTVEIAPGFAGVSVRETRPSEVMFTTKTQRTQR
jgi:YbbR domain-containing protein